MKGYISEEKMTAGYLKISNKIVALEIKELEL
jgi:hypothetical protein